MINKHIYFKIFIDLGPLQKLCSQRILFNNSSTNNLEITVGLLLQFTWCLFKLSILPNPFSQYLHLNIASGPIVAWKIDLCLIIVSFLVKAFPHSSHLNLLNSWNLAEAKLRLIVYQSVNLWLVPFQLVFSWKFQSTLFTAEAIFLVHSLLMSNQNIICWHSFTTNVTFKYWKVIAMINHHVLCFSLLRLKSSFTYIAFHLHWAMGSFLVNYSIIFPVKYFMANWTSIIFNQIQQISCFSNISNRNGVF